MIRHALALFLALALPAVAQQFGVGGEVYPGGPSQQWFGFGKSSGTSGPGVYMTPPKGLRGWWDPGAGDSMVWGGTRPGGVDDFLDNDSATPVTENSYPIVIFGWAMCDNPATASQCLLQFGNATGSESFSVAVSTTGYLRAMSTDGGVAVEADTAAAAIDATVRFRYIAVFESTTSRSIYCDQDLTGATNTTSSNPTGIDRVRFFGWRDGTTDWLGIGGTTHVFANATVPSSDQRTAFLRDCHDPEVIMGTRARALWLVGDSPLTDQRGSVTLSEDGNSLSHFPNVWAIRDQSGQNNALWHRSSASSAARVERSVAALNSQVQADFSASATGTGLRTGPNRTPATAAPLQFYVVVDNDTIANNDVIMHSGIEGSGSTEYFRISHNSTTTFQVVTAGATARSAVSGGSFSTNTGYLIWGNYPASTSRTIEVNGGNSATESTNAVPTTPTFLSVMHYGGTTMANVTDAQLGLVVILNTNSIAGQPSIERFTSAAYALGF